MGVVAIYYIEFDSRFILKLLKISEFSEKDEEVFLEGLF